MRERLNPLQRKSAILKQALDLFHQRGFASVEMADICKASGVSRGGLYHHFGSKGAVLDAIVAAEIGELASALGQHDVAPIEMLLESGSIHLGNDAGVAATLRSTSEKLAYLSSLDTAFSRLLYPILAEKLTGSVRPDVDPGHIAELFLTVNAQINRRVFLGDWSELQGARFAATALEALVPFFKDPTRLRQLIQKFQSKNLEK